MKNIVLIGMPGAGKSTTGVLLAKTLGRKFIDTDLLVQEETERFLQEIIDTDGPDAFMAIEEKTILSLRQHRAVIATGGSVVYSAKAMAHLREHGVIVYLQVSYDEMVKRLKNITTRGIVLHPGQDMKALYDERVPRYGSWADLTVSCTDGDIEECVGKIVDGLRPFPA